MEPETEAPVELAAADPQDSEPIYEKNAFDQYRGEEPPSEPVEELDDPEPEPSNYTFEVRGIHILGEKKLALIAAEPIRRVKGKIIPAKSSSSTQSVLVREGEDIEGTGHKVAKIEPGRVTLQNSSGIDYPLDFDLTSDSSLKRAEAAYKYEVGRQKQFAKQNAFPGGPKTASTTSSKAPATSASNSNAAKIASIQKRYGDYKKKVYEAYKSGKMSKDHMEKAMKRIGEGYEREVKKVNGSSSDKKK